MRADLRRSSPREANSSHEEKAERSRCAPTCVSALPVSFCKTTFFSITMCPNNKHSSCLIAQLHASFLMLCNLTQRHTVPPGLLLVLCTKMAFFYLGCRILSNEKIKPKLQRNPIMPGNFTNHYRYNLDQENFT